MLLTQEQCRTARGLLDSTKADLARATGLIPETIKNFEWSIWNSRPETKEAILRVFAVNGIEFVENSLRRKPDHIPCRRCGYYEPSISPEAS